MQNLLILHSAIGRFAQADSIVPPGVQGYDRYAYINNNPLNFTHPSGHLACMDDQIFVGGNCVNAGDGSDYGYGGGGGGGGGDDDDEEVNWPDVVEDLGTEADRIRNDLAEQLLADVIGEAVMIGGGWVIGGLKCPGGTKLYCSTVGGVIGFGSSFYI